MDPGEISCNNSRSLSKAFLFERLDRSNQIGWTVIHIWNFSTMICLFFLEMYPLRSGYDRGPSSHFHVEIHDRFNQVQGIRWIGRWIGPAAWPPRFPDLNPLDFFWGGGNIITKYKILMSCVEALYWPPITCAFRNSRKAQPCVYNFQLLQLW